MDVTKEVSRMKYENKHFEMPVEAVQLGVRELVFDSIYECVSAWQGSISKRSANKLEDIREVLLKLTDEYVLEAQKSLETAELKIRSCFAIPDHVLLPGDEHQRQQFTKDEEADLDNKLENLKLQYKNALCMEKLLKEEKKAFEEVDSIHFQCSKLKVSLNDEPQSLRTIDRLALEVKTLENSSCNQESV